MAITNGYITLSLLKSALSINDEIDDDFLELAINAASRQIDQVCERQFFSTTETRVFAPRDSFNHSLKSELLMSISSQPIILRQQSR